MELIWGGEGKRDTYRRDEELRGRNRERDNIRLTFVNFVGESIFFIAIVTAAH